ncbi:ER membrane protein complex subunit 8/9 homolog, partial [Phalaenopsis equestris]|uniref:ER membrane protein complex subunit 8/9 homolog n=1 Tax=Phalaenopsis equestris TaxID=78828 RepID=UPI0009E5088B
SVPLFHSQIGILPYLELALIQVEEHFASDGLGVVGYYHANERKDDAELSGAAKKIGDHIFRYFPQAALLLLDSKKLEGLPKGKGRDPVLQ